MNQYGSVRGIAIGFGLAYLIGFFLFGDLLGSSADSPESFKDHFDNPVSRTGDILGALSLVVASGLMVGLGLTLRHELAEDRPRLKVDLVAGLAGLSAGGLLVAAGMLLAPPLWQTFGDLTGDPGLDPPVAAGIAQAGTAVLLLSLLPVSAWSGLSILLARKTARIPGWMAVLGWIAAFLAPLGVTVAAALPIGLWWIGVGILWRPGGE